MKSKKTILLILIFIAMMIPEIRAITPQEQTVKITDTHDDAFITETGIKIDASLCHIKDPNMDIRAFLVFRELEINWWEPLENATLRLRTSGTLSFEADSSVTIYGMKIAELQDLGWLTASDVSMIGYTSAYVNYNTSQFYGSQWHEIDVTDIVEELIRHPHWDGDGHAGTETGDAIGFHIFGAEGNEKRYFIDKKLDNGQEAQLVIHWNHEPPPPAGDPDAEFNGTYRGYHIWMINGSEAGWINYNDYTFYNISGGEDFAIVSDDIITGDKIKAHPNWDFRLRRVNPSNNNFVLLSINITEVYDTQEGYHQWPGHIFGHANVNENVYTIDNSLYKGVFLTVATPQNATDNLWQFAITTHNAGAWNIRYGIHYNASKGLRYYLNITYNYPSRNFIVKVHSSPLFDAGSLLENLNWTGYANIMTGYGHEFAYNSESRPGDSDYFSFNTLSDTGVSWVVTDENGTTIADDLDEYEDAILVIEDELGADPEDPDPPAEGWDTEGPFTRFKTRFYILIIGIFLVLGPPMMFAYRRPTGYAFLIGCFIMLVGLSFLIHVGSV